MTWQLRIVGSLLLAALSGAAAAGPTGDEASAYAAYKRADYATALRSFRPLADQGRADAQYMLGLMYDDGIGVLHNYIEAARWYRLAATQGRADAQYNLGLMSYDGRGEPQNYFEAVRWYRLAAAKGRSDAQNNLALMYHNGEGVPQSNALALVWFGLSAAQGYKVAIENRELIAASMTPAQLAEAQKLARDWTPVLLGVVRQDVNVAAATPALNTGNQSEADHIQSFPVLGHASVPTLRNPDTSPNRAGEPVMFDINGHYIGPPERGYLAQVRQEKTLLDLSRPPVGTGRRRRYRLIRELTALNWKRAHAKCLGLIVVLKNKSSSVSNGWRTRNSGP